MYPTRYILAPLDHKMAPRVDMICAKAVCATRTETFFGTAYLTSFTDPITFEAYR